MNLDRAMGAEATKIRSCLVVQNDVGNRHGRRTVVMPLLPGSKVAPYTVNIRASPEKGLDQDRYVDVGQIRSLDQNRVLGLVGVMEPKYWPRIQVALDIVLGFD